MVRRCGLDFFKKNSTEYSDGQFAAVFTGQPGDMQQRPLGGGILNHPTELAPYRDDQIFSGRSHDGNEPSELNLPASHALLLTRADVELVLRLDTQQVDFLVNTRQLTVLRIAGDERFSRRDLERLIETYKATAARRQS